MGIIINSFNGECLTYIIQNFKLKEYIFFLFQLKFLNKWSLTTSHPIYNAFLFYNKRAGLGPYSNGTGLGGRTPAFVTSSRPEPSYKLTHKHSFARRGLIRVLVSSYLSGAASLSLVLLKVTFFFSFTIFIKFTLAPSSCDHQICLFLLVFDSSVRSRVIV